MSASPNAEASTGEVAAFANAESGAIFFGVNDVGTSVGQREYVITGCKIRLFPHGRKLRQEIGIVSL